MREYFSITELTREFDVSTRTLRFYEDEGLITPLRRGKKRLYRPRERTRLMLIMRGKRVGLSLKEIREILDMYDREPGERGQLLHVIARARALRDEFSRKAHDLNDILGELDRIEAGCRKRLAALKSEGWEGRGESI